MIAIQEDTGTYGKSNQTKKIKSNKSKEEKNKLWQALLDFKDNDCKSIKNSSDSYIDSNLCYECQGYLMISEEKFPVCSDCGLIYDKILDYSAEWRNNLGDDRNTTDLTRCGNPINPLLEESSYGCTVLTQPNSSIESKIISKRVQWQSTPHREKTLYQEFNFITRMASNGGIPKIIIDDAISFHKDISEQKMFRGLNRDSIKAASIYISCRKNGCARTAQEIAEIFNLDKTSATTGCSKAIDILNSTERNGSENQTVLASTKPSDFIERFCSKLQINCQLTAFAKFLSNKIKKESIIDNNAPHSIAAGIIYFITKTFQLEISKNDIKTVSGVSEVTINKCFKKLESYDGTLIPSALLKKYCM